MIQIASLLVVATVFIGFVDCNFTVSEGSRPRAYTGDKTTYAGT